MRQYLILAYDGTDPGAEDRRMMARPSHFEMAKELKHHHRFITGGAILNDAGKMIGSMMVVQFETEDDLMYWMRNEPYITGDVWQNIEVKPFKTADV
ncbi:MAG: YciI family protein [Bacteroidota bacterium]